jgi:hypothetical protein
MTRPTEKKGQNWKTSHLKEIADTHQKIRSQKGADKEFKRSTFQELLQKN